MKRLSKDFIMFFCTIVFLILSTVTTFAAPSAPSAPVVQTPAISSLTVDGFLQYSGGDVLANKTVKLDSKVSKTDVQGYFKFENVEAGEHVLTVYSNGVGTTEILSAGFKVADGVLTSTSLTSKNTTCNIVNSSAGVYSFSLIYTGSSDDFDEKFTVKVYEKYFDEYGKLLSNDLRESKEYKRGDTYTYSATSNDNYTLISDKNVHGVVSEDVVITFVYQKKMPESVSTSASTTSPSSSNDKISPKTGFNDSIVFCIGLVSLVVFTGIGSVTAFVLAKK